MVEAGFSISGITGILNGAGGGRLRPARTEEDVGLLWNAEAPSLPTLLFELGLPTAGALSMPMPLPMPLPLPMAMPMTDPAPLDWPVPAARDAFIWSSIEWMPTAWATETTPGPERHRAPDDIRLPPGLLPEVPAWLLAETLDTGPDSPGVGPDLSPPRPPALPEPLFASPVLEGGAARQVSVTEGQDDAIHQPSVTDRPTDGLGWRITGGADAALLMMDPASGMLRFLTAPDFELPADADGDSRYEVIFEVRDSWGAAATQRLTITVEDAVWG